MSEKITIIGVNFYPEDSAIGLYSTQMAEFLAEYGYEVSVITGFPYYPQWKINSDYENKPKFLKESKNNISIFRYKMFVPQTPSFLYRILHILSFTWGNLFNVRKLDKQNLVIAVVPFTSSVFLGWLIKIRDRSKLWVHIQDFEFDAAVDSGIISKNKSVLIKPLFWVEKFLFSKADRVSTISHGMMAKLKQKTKSKTYYLTNWLDTDKFNLDNKECHPFLSSDKFKILYSGNVGAKQDWAFFYQFLDRIKTLKNIEIIIVGEGSEKEKLIENTAKYPFVKHYCLVPFKELPNLLKSADLHFLFQKENVVDVVMPSKILGMMGSGKPSILTGNSNSEVKTIVEQSKGGYYFGNSELDQLVAVIKNLIKDPNIGESKGQNAKKFVQKNYSKHQVLSNFIAELNKL